MYNTQQIQEIIAGTHPDLKGKPLEIIKARAVAIGRKMDKQTRNWYIVYATSLYGRTAFFVSKNGIIL